MIVTSASLTWSKGKVTLSFFFKEDFPAAVHISPVSLNIQVGNGNGASSYLSTSVKSMSRDCWSSNTLEYIRFISKTSLPPTLIAFFAVFIVTTSLNPFGSESLMFLFVRHSPRLLQQERLAIASSRQVLFPPQKVILTVVENKVQLTDLICAELVNKDLCGPHKLVNTGKDSKPVEVAKDICRRDWTWKHFMKRLMWYWCSRWLECLNLGSEVFQLCLVIQIFSSYYCIFTQTFTSHATLQWKQVVVRGRSLILQKRRKNIPAL